MSEHNITEQFAQFVERTEFSALSDEVVEQTKDYILDSIGCTLGGYSIPEGLLIARLGRAFGSGTGGTILPSGQKTSPVAAAYVNSQLCNLIDADETLYNYCHISGVPFFSALHAAEKTGVSGKEIIAATVLGYEFGQRFMLNFPLLTVNEQGGTDIAKTSGFGFAAIAAAVAAAKALKLDTEGIRNAMGIAGYHTILPLIPKWMHTPPPVSIHEYQDIGWFAFVGLISALWAEDGCEADQYIMDDFGEFSFWKAFGMSGFDFDALLNGLGENWGIMEMGIKPYPCTRWYSTPIYLFKQIMEKQDLKPDDITSITVKGHPAMAKANHITRVLRWDEWSPKDAINSQFSLSYNLACAAFDVPIGPRWQLRETLTDPRIVEFTKKVTAAKDEKCEQRMIAYLNSGQPKGKLMTQVHYTVEVDSTKGTFTDTAEYIYGDTYDPEHRLSRDALKEKFANNVSSIVDTKTTTELIEAIYRLESFDSIDEFVGLFE